jgi:hypothetical protein
MNRPFGQCALIIVFGLLAARTLAHGPQMQITNDNNKVVTRNVFAEEPYNTTLTSAKTAYVIPMMQTTALGGGLEFAARPFYGSSQGPGLAYGLGWTLTPPVTTFPVGSNFRLTFTEGLKRWNGSAFVDPGAEHLEMYRVTSNVIVDSAKTTDAGPFQDLDTAAITAPTTTAQLDAHSSLRWRLLGPGGTSTESTQDGVYMIGLTLDNSDASIAPSDPYYFVFHKNAPLSEVQAAVSAQFPNSEVVQFVPEPGSLCLASLATLALLRRR